MTLFAFDWSIGLEYSGIEFIDPQKRSQQHRATRLLWDSLNQSGLGRMTIGRITVFLYFDGINGAVALEEQFASYGDWTVDRYHVSKNDLECVRLLSPECEFTLDAFLELTDIMLIEADRHNGTFDGFEVAAENTRKRKRWFSIWYGK